MKVQNFCLTDFINGLDLQEEVWRLDDRKNLLIIIFLT